MGNLIQRLVPEAKRRGIGHGQMAEDDARKSAMLDFHRRTSATSCSSTTIVENGLDILQCQHHQ